MRRDPFSPEAPGRKCEFCKRGGAVTRHAGYWSHLRCFSQNKAKVPVPKEQLMGQALHEQAEAMLLGAKHPDDL